MFMFHKSFSIALLVTTLWATTPAAQENPVSFLADSVQYAWPTDATQYLSSTFGETRSSHLHSGIDIRTWGQEGYRVFAARSGVVDRIGIGPRGYGHVIYMKHNDGSYTVYAHLNRFEPELQAFADSIRMQNYTYELNTRPGVHRFRFNRGDLIGFTGSTGVGPPHLHFEVRDPDFNPVNPLLTNLKEVIADNLPPVFSQLGIEYLSPESYRFLGFELLTATPAEDGYTFGEVVINGPVGLSVNVHDKANRAPNSYAVHSLMMVHESDTLFHSVKNRLTAGETGDMFLDRSYPILAQTRRGFQRLYKVEGNRLPIYPKMQNRGVLHFNEGTYPIQVIAEDIYGNRTTANLTIRSEGTTNPGTISHVAAYPNAVPLPDAANHNWFFTEIPFELSLLASTAGQFHTPDYRNSRQFFTTRRSVENTLEPGRMGLLHTPDQKMWIQFPAESLYDTLNVRMEVIHSANRIDVTFSPTQLPLNGSVLFNYILPEEYHEMEHLALFSVDPQRSREKFIRSEISNGIVRARLREITNLRIRKDRLPPWTGRPVMDKNLAGQQIVRLPVKDGDTGIDYRRSTITVNNAKGITEYDPEKNLLIYYNPGFDPQRNNTVEYDVFDGAGNRTSGKVTLPNKP